MSGEQKTDGKKGTGNRIRRRLRGMAGTRAGKTIGISSLVAPVVGLVVNDLRKPDSIIRALLKNTATRLLAARSKKPEVIDITDRVEVIDNKGNQG
jgi:hypothetical protein